MGAETHMPKAVDALRKFVNRNDKNNASGSGVDEERVEGEIWDILRRQQINKLQKVQNEQPSLKDIPRFFFPKKKVSDEGSDGMEEKPMGNHFQSQDIDGELRNLSVVLQDECMHQARQQLGAEIEGLLLSQEDFSILQSVFMPDAQGPDSNDESSGWNRRRLLDFRDWQLLLTRLPQDLHFKLANVLTAKLFLQLRKDSDACVPAAMLLEYIFRREELLKSRIMFCKYDHTGLGVVRETDLEDWVYDQAHNAPQLANMPEGFIDFYAQTVLRRIMFFHDKHSTGKIPIKELICSQHVQEFMLLRREVLDPQELKNNWFSLRNATSLHRSYLTADFDKDGLLSQNELRNWEHGGFTEEFISRVFEEAPTFDGLMDYKAYLDFVLAYRGRGTAQGLRYYWKILDFRRRGKLTVFEINFFFKAVARQLFESGMLQVEVSDVKDEIFDMVRPSNPMEITFEDLINCGCGGTVVGMLTDCNAFFDYDNRENSLAEGADDEDE